MVRTGIASLATMRCIHLVVMVWLSISLWPGSFGGVWSQQDYSFACVTSTTLIYCVGIDEDDRDLRFRQIEQLGWYRPEILGQDPALASCQRVTRPRGE